MKIPDPLNFLADPWKPRILYSFAFIATAATAVCCIRSGGEFGLPFALGVVAAVAFEFAAIDLILTGTNLVRPRVLLGISAVLFFTGLWIAEASISQWILTAVAAALLLFHLTKDSATRDSSAFLLPIVLAAPLVSLAACAGTPRAGGFPACYVFMLSLIAVVTRSMEAQSIKLDSGEIESSFYQRFGKRLTALSTVFFMFGVVSLWPWLGKMYGFAYFWILITGVLFPVMYFWGRLRQPRGDNPQVALLRFNRILPYSAIVLFVAIAIG